MPGMTVLYFVCNDGVDEGSGGRPSGLRVKMTFWAIVGM